MKQQKVRSFLGAMLCTFFAIYPAATFNIPWLLLPMGFFGWAIGYHGDRILLGLKEGYKKANKIKFFSRPKCFKFKLNLPFNSKELVNSISEFFGFFISKIYLSLKWAFKKILGIFLWVITFKIITLFRGWLKKNPANKVFLTKTIIFSLIGIISLLGFIAIIYYHGMQIGDLKQPTLNGVTSNVTFIEALIANGFFLFFLLCLGFIIPLQLFLDKNNRISSFHTEWELFNKSKLRFIAKQTFGLIYSQLWVAALIFFFIAYVLFSLFSIFFIGVLFFGTIASGIRLTWYAIKLNKDYGLTSLVIGLITGSIVFFMLGNILLSNQIACFLISIVSGAFSGFISMVFTTFTENSFKKEGILRSIVQKEGIYKEGVFDAFMNSLGKTYPFLWKLWIGILPREISPFTI